MKSVLTLKANPGILKCGGRIRMWMWLRIERKSYLGFGNIVRIRTIGRNIVRQKKDAMRVVCMAMDQKPQKAVDKVDSCQQLTSCLELPNKKVAEKKDVVGVSCLKNESGTVKVSVDDPKKIWKEYMEKLMNVENEWSDNIDASKIEGAVRRIEVDEVRCVMNHMKIRKTSGPSGVAIELLRAGGDKCLKSLTNKFNNISLFKDK